MEHIQCARHIYANFRKDLYGLEFKKLLWDAAISCVEGNFIRNMETLKRLNPSIYECLMPIESKTWCKAYMGVRYAYEAIENGI